VAAGRAHTIVDSCELGPRPAASNLEASMTWNFRAFLLGLALLAMVAGFATRARAADALLLWQLPTTYEDGSPIGPGELRETLAVWKLCASSDAPASTTFPHPAETGTVTGLTPGEWCFRVAAVTEEGVQSDWSNEAVKTVVPPPPKPKPPVIVTIDIQATATLEQSSDGSLKLTVR
jgi:hypothetical protein